MYSSHYAPPAFDLIYLLITLLSPNLSIQRALRGLLPRLQSPPPPAHHRLPVRPVAPILAARIGCGGTDQQTLGTLALLVGALLMAMLTLVLVVMLVLPPGIAQRIAPLRAISRPLVQS
jgi:hypothetical protein